MGITQLLSMFGIAAEVNIMLWGYATNADACTMQETIEGDMLWHAVKELSMGAALMESYEGWMQAQFMALPMETQKEWMEAHIKEEMVKKEHMMMKAKELGIEMDKESDWSDKEEGDWDKEGDWEEKEAEM